LTDNDNDDDANDGDFPDTLGEILSAPFMATPALDLDLALTPPTPTSTSIALFFSLHSPSNTLPLTVLLFCCWYGAHV